MAAPTLVAFGTVTAVNNLNTPVNVPSPAGVIAGDVVFILGGLLYDVTWPSPPSGFTALANMPSLPQGYGTVAGCYKVSAGSEPSNYSVTLAGTPTGRVSQLVAVAIRGCDTTTPINAVNNVHRTSVTTGNPITGVSLTTTVPNCSYLSLCIEDSGHNTTITATSPATEITHTGSSTSWCAALDTTSGATTGTRTSGDYACGSTFGFWLMGIALAPAPVPPTVGGNATESDDTASGGATPGVAVAAGGGATEGDDTASGGGTIGNTATAGGNATEADDSASGGAGPYIGTIQTDPLGNWTLSDQSAYANLTIPNVHVIRLVTAQPWLQLTNQVTDSNRRLNLSDAKLLKNEWFVIVLFNADGSACGAKAYQAS